MLGIPRVSRFELARYLHSIENARVLDIGGVRVNVASVADIIRRRRSLTFRRIVRALVELRRLLRRKHDREIGRESSRLTLGTAEAYRSATVFGSRREPFSGIGRIGLQTHQPSPA